MLSEDQVTDCFREHGIFQDGNELYLERSMAPKFVEVCQKNNLAVIGFEGFLYDREEETVEPLSDQIADFSVVEASNWEEFRNLCNKYCKDLIRRLPPKDELVVNFTVLSQVEWWNKCMVSDQTTGEVGKPMEPNQHLEI